MTTVLWCDRCERGWAAQDTGDLLCPGCRQPGYRMGEFPAKVVPQAAGAFLLAGGKCPDDEDDDDQGLVVEWALGFLVMAAAVLLVLAAFGLPFWWLAGWWPWL